MVRVAPKANRTPSAPPVTERTTLSVNSCRTIVNLMPDFYVPNEARVAINMPVLAFTAVVAVLTGILFGLVPALRMSRPAVADALKAGRSTGFESDGRRSRSALVIAEVTLSVVLLVSAGLTIRTFFRLTSIDPGISQDRVMLVGLPLTPSKYLSLDQRNQFAEQLLDRVGTLPGVESASIGHPFGGPHPRSRLPARHPTTRSGSRSISSAPTISAPLPFASRRTDV